MKETTRGLSGADLIAEVGVLAVSVPGARRMLQAVASACIEHGCSLAAFYLAGQPPAANALDPRVAEALRRSNPEGARDVAGEFGLDVRSAPISGGSLVLGTADERLAGLVARVLSAGLDHVEATAAQHRVADRLQRALLPSQLASHPALRFDASYRPATQETEVGGDWYDAFNVGDGRIAISIGDIAGHGLDAAIAMGEARRAIRSAAAGFNSPSELLEFVNGNLCRDGGLEMATAIVGYFEPAQRTYVYASAGHPPQLYIDASGRPHQLPGGGLPLGFSSGIASDDFTVTIDPGTALVLYTDGLLEYGRDIIAGERILIETVGRSQLAHAAAPATALTDAIFAEVENTDDAAAMVIVGDGEISPRRRWRWSAYPAAASVAREVVREYVREMAVDRAIVERVIPAFGEAIANAIEHGRPSGRVEVAMETKDGSISLEVSNQGSWVEFVEHDERGRGIAIMNAFADGIAISSTSDMTTMRLTFRARR